MESDLGVVSNQLEQLLDSFRNMEMRHDKTEEEVKSLREIINKKRGGYLNLSDDEAMDEGQGSNEPSFAVSPLKGKIRSL